VRLLLAPVERQEQPAAAGAQPLSILAMAADERLSIVPVAVRNIATIAS
jgi:hypothetical protein